MANRTPLEVRIKQIVIRGYNAFYGTKEINVEGKNLFVYGENGSGKSSLYYALNDFFPLCHPISYAEFIASSENDKIVRLHRVALAIAKPLPKCLYGFMVK